METILTIPDLKDWLPKMHNDGVVLLERDDQRYFVSETWYNEWILHVDVYKGKTSQIVSEGDPVEKWIILQKDNLFDARRVTTDETENDVIHAFGDILAVMNHGKLHVYVEMFQGNIETVKIFDVDEEYQKAYKAWKKKMGIEDEPVEDAFRDEGTSVQGFETRIE